MEYAKDEIFKITYNSSIDRLQIPKESWTSKLSNKMKKHKWISFIIVLFLIFSCINFLLIYYFFRILQTASFI